MFINLAAGGGAGTDFLTDVGLNVVGAVTVAGLGACFDTANAYEGVVVLDLVELKLKPVEGRLDLFSIRSRVLDIWSRRSSSTSGTLQPNLLTPARTLSILWSSLLFAAKMLRLTAGMT